MLSLKLYTEAGTGQKYRTATAAGILTTNSGAGKRMGGAAVCFFKIYIKIYIYILCVCIYTHTHTRIEKICRLGDYV